MKLCFIIVVAIFSLKSIAQPLVPNGNFESLPILQWYNFGNKTFEPCNAAFPDATNQSPCQIWHDHYSCLLGIEDYDLNSCQDPYGANNFTYVLLQSDEWGLETTGMYCHLASPLQCGAKYQITFDVSRYDKDDGGSFGIQIGLADFSNWNESWDGRTKVDDLDETAWTTNTSGWDHNTFEFQVPCDRCSLNTLLIWANVPFSTVTCFSAYSRLLYLDNIVLTEITDACSATLGTLNPTISEAHNDAFPFTVFNLGNVSYFDLSIFYGNGQVDHIGPLNDPPSQVCWDGKDNNGLEFPNGAYTYSLDLSNSCEPNTNYIGGFSKTNDIGTTAKICMCDQTISKPDLLCCSDDITIANQTILWDPTTPSPLIYGVKNSITFGENINIPFYTCMDAVNHVQFYAGNYLDFSGASIDPTTIIDIEPGTSIGYFI